MKQKRTPILYMIEGNGKFGDYRTGMTVSATDNLQYWKDRGYTLVPLYALDTEPTPGPPTILPDGSALFTASLPLPEDHWLYVESVYEEKSYEPKDLPAPILTHALRDHVVSAVRYAVRAATMNGTETDFDPDALVQNAVYALCGPYT